MLDIKKLREKNLHPDNVKGKTISRIYYRFESMVILFEDSTFTALEAEYHEETIEIVHDISPNLTMLTRAGVITGDDLREYEKYAQEQRMIADEKRELEMFKRLKDKYEKQ